MVTLECHLEGQPALRILHFCCIRGSCQQDTNHIRVAPISCHVQRSLASLHSHHGGGGRGSLQQMQDQGSVASPAGRMKRQEASVGRSVDGLWR